MPPLAFDLVEDLLVPGEAMKEALARAARDSNARLVSVERVGAALRIVYDRDVSQALIVEHLREVLGAST